MKNYKHKITFLIMFSFSNLSFSQNLVSNCSFEDTAFCPDSYGQINRANGWSSYGGSPEYFNACSPWMMVNVPNNALGFQYAATGNAYAGIVVYDRTDTLNNLEYIGRELSQNLIVGQNYFVSFKINLPKKDTASINQDDCAIYACNKIGVLFSTIPYNENNPPKRYNFAHLYTDSIILDTLNWITISGWFIPDSSYKYIILGRFYDNLYTDTIRIYQPLNAGCDVYAYYFFDDICVSVDSAKCICDSGNSISEKIAEKFTIYPNPTYNKIIVKNHFNNKASIKIYDLLGKLHFEISLIDSDNEIILNDLSKGIYIINIQSDNKTFNQKLFIN